MTERGLPPIERLWAEHNFEPNDNQRAAILHLDGPLYLPAGPGSGKTRVLLWRALNLIVYHGVGPEEIYLSTFTEKAALQLREGLRALLGSVSHHTDRPYDLAKMYVGTVHSLCQKLLADRRFTPARRRNAAPVLLDELGQYLYLYKRGQWAALTDALGEEEQANRIINACFGSQRGSRHDAVANCIGLFNRLSEERIDPAAVQSRTADEGLRTLLDLYEKYRAALLSNPRLPRTDFSLLQQHAVRLLEDYAGAGDVFKHVIIDEYQDTNTIQEQLFFRLAAGGQNLCVVGDDDQALYRFRGATVENFVEFPTRCQRHFHRDPVTIPLATNYRSRQRIVHFYTGFICHPTCDWRKDGRPAEFYRVTTKDIRPASQDAGPAVITSTRGDPESVCAEIAGLVRGLIDSGKVSNPNQIAFLYPSLKSVQVGRMSAALEAQGLKVYAPRAGRFLEVPEAVALFGLMAQIFGRPERGELGGHDYNAYHDWLDLACTTAEVLMADDPGLAAFVADRRSEASRVTDDYQRLVQEADARGWELEGPYDLDHMRSVLLKTQGLSVEATRSIHSPYFERMVRARQAAGERPVTLEYVINRATSLDWNVLDLFYRLCGFRDFKRMFDDAEHRGDEGPVCNLSLVSQYLGRFLDEYASILSGDILAEDRFQRLLFSSYLYALFRRGESEYENAEDPFPKGRIPFLTIHQAKGLEFPVVVLGNPQKINRGPQNVEEMVRPLLDREGEPLDRLAQFDIMRMFYVALSRAENLLVLAHYHKAGAYPTEPFKSMLADPALPRIPGFDLRALPAAKDKSSELPKNYSYTGDYLLYERCPRQYMIFRKYGFVPSRSQTMFFGSLVHQTMEDVHQHLIDRRQRA